MNAIWPTRAILNHSGFRNNSLAVFLRADYFKLLVATEQTKIYYLLLRNSGTQVTQELAV